MEKVQRRISKVRGGKEETRNREERCSNNRFYCKQ
jgi:hypothetical protein